MILSARSMWYSVRPAIPLVRCVEKGAAVINVSESLCFLIFAVVCILFCCITQVAFRLKSDACRLMQLSESGRARPRHHGTRNVKTKHQSFVVLIPFVSDSAEFDPNMILGYCPCCNNQNPSSWLSFELAIAMQNKPLED